MNEDDKTFVGIDDMIGKTITKIVGGIQDTELTFYTSDGYEYKMYHEQDCCETVYVEDISGDLNDLIGRVIVEASEVSQQNPHATESGTWTFYKLNSDRYYGGVCIRWNGESNGYYSESVALCRKQIISEEDENGN